MPAALPHPPTHPPTPQQRAVAAAPPKCELTTATNGLAWCDTEVGTGPAAVPKGLIRCHYTGRLMSNGAVFDSSYDRGRPLPFTLGVGMVIQVSVRTCAAGGATQGCITPHDPYDIRHTTYDHLKGISPPHEPCMSPI
jgi:FKBP-type peptidyl-prolyl cis-trans isomerase